MSSPDLQLSADPVRKKRKGKLLPMLLALLVLGGGGGAYWWLNRGLVEAAPKVTPLAERGLIAFEPFMVNLSDGGGTRFLKVSLQLVMENEAAAAKVGGSPVVLSRVRSDILELLTEQTAASLVTPEGKQSLKSAIKARVTDAVEQKQVIDVLFSEFVVQF